MKTNEVYLHHILDAIRKVESYTSGIDRDAFEKDDMRQDAVIRQIEIIGEASRQLSDDFQEEHDSIPWSDIIGMRNRIAHDYMNVILTSSGRSFTTTFPHLESVLILNRIVRARIDEAKIGRGGRT